jgi:hypothetical protein
LITGGGPDESEEAEEPDEDPLEYLVHRFLLFRLSPGHMPVMRLCLNAQ